MIYFCFMNISFKQQQFYFMRLLMCPSLNINKPLKGILNKSPYKIVL